MVGAIEYQTGSHSVVPDDSFIHCRTLSPSWGIQGTSSRRQGQQDRGWVSGHQPRGLTLEQQLQSLQESRLAVLFNMEATSHMWLLKLNKNSVPQSYQPHFKYTVVTCVCYIEQRSADIEHFHQCRKFCWTALERNRQSCQGRVGICLKGCVKMAKYRRQRKIHELLVTHITPHPVPEPFHC